jgi:hypothetical protein
MVTAVAPTMPVDAASRAPTTTTENPKPPRRRPNSPPMRSSKSSAMRDCSSITPIKMKTGIASSTSLVITPKMRCGNAPRMPKLMALSMCPSTANASDTPASVSATG